MGPAITQERYVQIYSEKMDFAMFLPHQYELCNSKTAFVRNEQGSGMYENTGNSNETKLPTQ